MEIFDVVDEEGVPTGETVEREEAHARGVPHRTAHIWVVRRAEGRLQVLLQKRADGKDSFPGCWDTSSAGHIHAGDGPRESAVRELGEELGIGAAPEDLHYAGKFHISFRTEFHGRPFADNEVSFVYVYVKMAEPGELHLQAEEVQDAAWFDAQKVQEALERKDPAFCVPPEGLEIACRWAEENESVCASF